MKKFTLPADVLNYCAELRKNKSLSVGDMIKRLQQDKHITLNAGQMIGVISYLRKISLGQCVH